MSDIVKKILKNQYYKNKIYVIIFIIIYSGGDYFERN